MERYYRIFCMDWDHDTEQELIEICRRSEAEAVQAGRDYLMQTRKVIGLWDLSTVRAVPVSDEENRELVRESRRCSQEFEELYCYGPGGTCFSDADPGL